MTDLNVLVQVVIVISVWMLFNFILSWFAVIALIKMLSDDDLIFKSSSLEPEKQLNLDLEFNDETKVKQDDKVNPAKGP